jgi:hypothetical protein
LKTKEIEEGLKREFIETIQDQRNSWFNPQTTFFIHWRNPINNLKERDISTVWKWSLTSLLGQQLREGNHIQVLIHSEKNTKVHNPEDQFDSIYNLERDYPNQLEIQHITSAIYDRLNVFISDRETISIIESNKSVNNKLISGGEDLFDLLGLATYSNSESTVSLYATIFDIL